jgi:hypothetical protein
MLLTGEEHWGHGMDEFTFRLWLRQTGLWSPTLQAPPAKGPLLSATETAELPPTAASAASAPIDTGDDDDLNREGHSDPEDYGGPGFGWENTELVAAVFRAAGNPRFQDVTLRVA